MAENAQKDACGFTNPRCPSLDDVIAIYKSALQSNPVDASLPLLPFKGGRGDF
jgi:hypothetical protein